VRSPLAGALAALALLAPTAALGQGRTPARVSVSPLFGEGTLLPDAWSSLYIEVENRQRTRQRGALHVSTDGLASTLMRREVHVDVPPGETRVVVVPIYDGPAGGSVRASFDGPQGPLGSDRISIEYRPTLGSVVVLGDPPRLRGALLDLDVQVDARRVTRFPVGAVRFDAATSDPLLPREPAAWSSVALLVASASALSRVGRAQRPPL